MSESTKIYVSLSGNPSWSGLFKTPTPGDSDGPLNSIEQARNNVRALKETYPERNFEIIIREGTYRLKDTIVFNEKDHRATGKTIFKAYENEQPVITSGVLVSDWKKVSDPSLATSYEANGKIWEADIPKGVDSFQTMFDGFSILKRATSPAIEPLTDIDYNRVDSMNVAHEKDRKYLQEIEVKNDLLKNWDNIQDIEISTTPVPWTFNIIPLKEVDVENGKLSFAAEATAPLWSKNPNGLCIENSIEFINKPGQWCVNTKTRKIYYWPKGDNPSDEIQVPCLNELIKVEGTINESSSEDVPVSGIHFKNLTFAHGDRYRWHMGLKGKGIQHDWELHDRATALVRFRGAENCAIDSCRFTTTGGTAVRLDLHCQNIRIKNSLFDYIGHMGILLCGYGPGTKDANHSNVIENNLMHHCGEVVFHGHAIFVWQSGNNQIRNNNIHHVARKAIGICGVRITILQNPTHLFDEAVSTIRWDEIKSNLATDGDDLDRFTPFNHAKDNIIEFNDISHPLEKLGDGSALNVSGAAENNIVRNNYLHHVTTYNASSVMRVDDWQKGTTFENNIVYKSNIGAITRKSFNHIKNNMFIDASRKGYVRFASYPGETPSFGSVLQNNIFYESEETAVFYTEAYIASPHISLPKNCNADHNLFYCSKDKLQSEKELAKYQEDKIESNSVVADPMFIDLENENFELHPRSPAIKMGFVPISTKHIGLTKDFPEHLKKLDYSEKEDPLVYTRGMNTDQKAYAWW